MCLQTDRHEGEFNLHVQHITNLIHTSAPLHTFFCEPGRGAVGVDGAKPDHLAELGAFTDGHADQRVGLLRDHQHLKHLQRTRQREVDVLSVEEREAGSVSLVCEETGPQTGSQSELQQKGIHQKKRFHLDEHELLHGLHPLQQHDTGLEGSTQILVACVRVSHCNNTTHHYDPTCCVPAELHSVC